MMELRVVPKFLKGIGHTNSGAAATRHQQLHYYQERQLSFDETPVFHVKMHRPASMRFLLPCISPEEVDFDYDFGADEYDNGVYGYDQSGRKSFTSTSSSGGGEEEEEEKEGGYEGCDELEKSPYPLEEEGNIDSKAEKFIADFYQQMKLQRQVSYLEYTEMINRGAS
ncbi:hypothetical protein COLO4_23265 [Corchorus olitorius]|uniref:Cotton fiber protein n=1 Tax=Corchorus olitorius TaxID=93759 RepID=A0A1R3IHJ6_9ROSI|nr:hypothetical protein COLO4_23265 [Corchorus olitorius]